MKIRKPLLITWLLALGAVIAISFMDSAESNRYFGIAETKETVVSSENAVEIMQITVAPGQTVTLGDTLARLYSPELNFKINEIAHQLEELKAQKVMKSGDVQTQINQLKAQRASITNEYNFKINQLKMQSSINKELAADLKSIQPAPDAATSKIKSPAALRIEGLEREKQMALNLVSIKINALNKALSTSGDPVKVQIESLEKELAMLEMEKTNLVMTAQINGVIGSVNFKQGEKVSPFTPILTLHTRSPSTVMGYIHENVYHRVSEGEKVIVSSMTGKGNSVTGKVIGVGSRIVAFPLRLQKRPEIPIWGREVQIKIPERNNFLLGEKVTIRPLHLGDKIAGE